MGEAVEEVGVVVIREAIEGVVEEVGVVVREAMEGDNLVLCKLKQGEFEMVSFFVNSITPYQLIPRPHPSKNVVCYTCLCINASHLPQSGNYISSIQGLLGKVG